MEAKYFFDQNTGRITLHPKYNFAVLEPQFIVSKKISGFGVFDLIKIGGEVAQIISLISESHAAVWVVPHDLALSRIVFFVSGVDLAEHAELLLTASQVKSQIKKLQR